MELCTSRAISDSRFLANPPQSPLRSNPSLASIQAVYFRNSSLRATSSQEASTGSRMSVVEEPITRNGYQPLQKNLNVGSETDEKEESTEDTFTDEQTQASEFLDKLGVKLDLEDPASVLLLGGGSLIAVWISTVLLGAIDSIPVFPKLMEVVGLAYTLWFSTRYLLLKKNREELVVQIEEIKQQVLGSSKEV